MRVAVMQPYLFPHLPYFQLIHAVDRFIILDDVQFITRGWINRNRILLHGAPHRFTLPVRGASQRREIRSLERADDATWRESFMRTLHHAYARAPGYDETMELVRSVLEHEERALAPWLVWGLQRVCAHLGFSDRIAGSSVRFGNAQLNGVDRLVDICVQSEATCYVNAVGGRALYDSAPFAERAIDLRFMQSAPLPYRQFGEQFVPDLSILDLLMFNSADEARRRLGNYTLDA